MCQTLFSSPVVQQKAPEIGRNARQIFGYLKANQRRGTDFRIALDPNWCVDVREQGICGATGRTQLYFGGEIVFEAECLQRQVLTVVIVFRANEDSEAIEGRPRLNAGDNHVVRRFHFDFDLGVAGSSTPLAHLQIGGRLNKGYLSLSDADPCRYELFDRLDVPRLPWVICDLPIVLDIFLRQFPTDLEEFVGGPEWRQRVMDSERLWLMDFFQHASAMMGSEANRECLYDYCCTESAFNQP